MGFYFQTRFYPNMSDSGTYKVLGAMNRIIDYADMERGWFRADDLLRIYSEQVSPTDLSTNSWVVEYMWSTHELTTELKEVCRLPVN